MTTEVVNVVNQKYDIFVGRPSKWGNPFVIGKDGTREEVIIKYEKWIRQQPKLLQDLPELIGKKLGCFCFPKDCHANVLVKLSKEMLLDEC